MRKIFALFAIALFFAACQNKETKVSETTILDTTAFPYQIKNYDQWQMNSDQKNIILAMNTVKAFANLDTNALKPLLGDSIHLRIDSFEFRGANSEFLKLAQQEMDKYKNISIEMQDIESVISNDKKTEYVSLWYKQHWEEKDGKKDSISYFNDLKIKNGKVVEWTEYVQHFMKK